jgi:hypothetical protein
VGQEELVRVVACGCLFLSWRRLAIAGAMLLVVLMALQGCGGIKDRTPAGNYPLTVNASSVNTVPAQTATATVNLVVN